jgi:hypothetical protein
MLRAFMTVIWAFGLADPSGIKRLPRSFQLSPTRPSASDSSASWIVSRLSTSGRRTIILKTPRSFGAWRIFSMPAVSSGMVRCMTVSIKSSLPFN